jgi:hypothetical protein
VVRSASQFESGTIQADPAPINDARQKNEIVTSGQWLRIVPNKLRQWHARKVVASPLGQVSEARD